MVRMQSSSALVLCSPSKWGATSLAKRHSCFDVARACTGEHVLPSGVARRDRESEHAHEPAHTVRERTLRVSLEQPLHSTALHCRGNLSNRNGHFSKGY